MKNEEHTKDQKAEKTAQRGIFVVMGHNRIKATKFYGPWVAEVYNKKKNTIKK